MTEQQVCEKCGASIPQGSEFILETKKDEQDTVYCSTCVAAMEKTIQEETDNVNLFGAVLFGFIAAGLSALIWYGIAVLTKYEIGIVAIVVGWIVAQAVIWGAGHKRGPIVQVISVVLIVLAMILSEYFIIRHFFVLTLTKEAAKQVPLFLPVKAMFNLMVDVVKSDPIILLFWLIAVIEGIVLPARRKLKLNRPSSVHSSYEK